MKTLHRIIYMILKKVVCAFLIINCFNFICGTVLISIPVNVLSILIIAVLGIPGIIAINLIYFLIWGIYEKWRKIKWYI